MEEWGEKTRKKAESVYCFDKRRLSFWFWLPVWSRLVQHSLQGGYCLEMKSATVTSFWRIWIWRGGKLSHVLILLWKGRHWRRKMQTVQRRRCHFVRWVKSNVENRKQMLNILNLSQAPLVTILTSRGKERWVGVMVGMAMAMLWQNRSSWRYTFDFKGIRWSGLVFAPSSIHSCHTHLNHCIDHLHKALVHDIPLANHHHLMVTNAGDFTSKLQADDCSTW